MIGCFLHPLLLCVLAEEIEVGLHIPGKMLDDSTQTVLGEIVPGSLSSTPFQQYAQLQPFCGDVEGWGPLSRLRFDLTPCFLDVGASVVALFGLVLGSGALWFLLNKRIPQPVSKNWHFYAKLVSLWDYLIIAPYIC